MAKWSCCGVHDTEGGDDAIPERLTSLDKTPLSLHLSLSFLRPSLPVSQHLDTFGMEGRRGEKRGGLVSSLPSHCSPGGSGLVCDLVSHMIETHLILLGINILQWNRGDSRREERGEDERQDG